MGFDVDKFIGNVSEDRKCSLCHLVLDNPVKTPCTHVFCSGCVFPWVMKHGTCPFGCRALTPGDLDNVLTLRELVLGMNVVCEYKAFGCAEVCRLADLPKHLTVCDVRPVQCRNKACGIKHPLKFLAQHEVHECDFRPVGICNEGCELVLLHNDLKDHSCVPALKKNIVIRDKRITALEEEIRRLAEVFKARETEFLGRVTSLQKKIHVQAVMFKNQLLDLESQLPYSYNNNCCGHKCGDDKQLTFVLDRSAGTLGLNIMGGFVAENNNKNNNNNNHKEGMVTEGIIVSKVTDGGPAQKKGLQNHDQIVKVNGRDLSHATHEEAVEAFRTAEEPIVVEVLRRVNKNKMKTRPTSTMVSVGTQTDEDIYGFGRPPTPPPGFYPIYNSGLLEPSSRRPVVFSNNEMGLTDIEMAQFEYDDAYFDDRQYEVDYEEVILQRPINDEKLGLTLCYGTTEDGITDIFIGEIDPYSIAAKDGRLRENDQIIQINGMDVHSREQAIKLFSEKGTDISLLVARPQIQIDDGFMDEQNVVLDALQMDILEKHHHDNMQIMASMLARGHHFDEEGGTTDTGTTENSSNKHEKDSGVGRTDESTKNDESSEQDVFDNESMMGTRKSVSSKGTNSGDTGDQLYSNDSFVSNENADGSYEIPDTRSDKFREVLEHRCDMNNLNRVSSPRKNNLRKYSESTEGSVDRELAHLNKDVDGMHIENIDPNKSVKGVDVYKTPRSVPRMGTRLDKVKIGTSPGPESSDSSGRRDTPTTPKMGQTRICKNIDKDGSVSTSAYNTGESCRSTPLTLELNFASDEGDKGFKNSMLCLAPTSHVTTPPLPAVSDTEKQTQTPAPSHDCSSDDSNYMTIADANNLSKALDNNNKEKEKCQINAGESLQDLYMQYADVMYTNHANLEHTIQVQQKLFQQQLDQRGTSHRRKKSSSPSSRRSTSTLNGNQSPSDSPQHSQQTPPDSGQMEWVVKRRPDGTRYITRRQVKSKMLKERAKKISEERCGMTTDDDAMSELKTGRYWTKEERKRHLEKARDYKKRRELMVRAKMETLKEADEKKDIVELSHRKMMKHKGKKVLDDFTTVQEMLAHGSKSADGKTYNPLLSVTTV